MADPRRTVSGKSAGDLRTDPRTYEQRWLDDCNAAGGRKRSRPGEVADDVARPTTRRSREGLVREYAMLLLLERRNVRFKDFLQQCALENKIADVEFPAEEAAESRQGKLSLVRQYNVLLDRLGGAASSSQGSAAPPADEPAAAPAPAAAAPAPAVVAPAPSAAAAAGGEPRPHCQACNGRHVRHTCGRSGSGGSKKQSAEKR